MGACDMAAIDMFVMDYQRKVQAFNSDRQHDRQTQIPCDLFADPFDMSNNDWTLQVSHDEDIEGWQQYLDAHTIAGSPDNNLPFASNDVAPIAQQPLYYYGQQFQQPQQHLFPQPVGFGAPEQLSLAQSIVPHGSTYEQANGVYFSPYAEGIMSDANSADLDDAFASVVSSSGYLFPRHGDDNRLRATSPLSDTFSVRSRSDVSRSVSPNVSEMSKWGHKNENGTWSCAYPDCSSVSTFTRGCDLRKHYKRHTKTLFCRHDGCPQAVEGGFSSKKDRLRHEAKHNPDIVCEWDGCHRVFSRLDNMKDHVRRVHVRNAGR